jgi:hypothetical protein
LESPDWKVWLSMLMKPAHLLWLPLQNRVLIGINLTLKSALQVRLESIEAVNKILEEANKRIQPNGTGMHLS